LNWCDDLVHGLRRARGRGRAPGGHGYRPAREALAQGAEELVRVGRDPRQAQLVQVLVHLGPAARALGRFGHCLGEELPARVGSGGVDGGRSRRPRRERGPREALEQQREAAHAARDLRADGHGRAGGGGGVRGQRRRSEAAHLASRLAVQDLHGRRGTGGRCPQVAQVRAQELAVPLWAELEKEDLQLLEITVQRRLRDETEIPHRVDLAQGVEEIVGDRHLGPGSVVLGRDPHLDLGGRDLRGKGHQHAQRVRHHQGREAVGEVLLELVQRLFDLGAVGGRVHASVLCCPTAAVTAAAQVIPAGRDARAGREISRITLSPCEGGGRSYHARARGSRPRPRPGGATLRRPAPPARGPRWPPW